MQEYTRNFLVDEPIPGIEVEYAFAQKCINVIELGEINALSKKYFRPDNKVIVVNAPKKDDYVLPTDKEILAMVNETAQKNVSPLCSSEILLSFDSKSDSSLTDYLDFSLFQSYP